MGNVERRRNFIIKLEKGELHVGEYAYEQRPFQAMTEKSFTIGLVDGLFPISSPFETLWTPWPTLHTGQRTIGNSSLSNC
jgi:hypothetical protein